MGAWSPIGWVVLAAVTFALTASCTRLSITYAHRRKLLDLPGQRRSHSAPTPRGGGIGIVAGVLFVIALIARRLEGPYRVMALALLAAIVVVAVVGWIDDHAGLRARTRFAVHCLAAALLLAVPAAFIGLLLPESRAGELLLYALAAVLPGLAIVWSINLHNFMDGIDGLLTLQVLFVFAALAAIFMHAAQTDVAECIGLLAAAVLGFLPFNFPRAHIFMGDVGSGVLGLLVAVAVGGQMLTPTIALASGFVLCSAFVTDATCTLLSRMLRGRRWYSAHREHLYQWLVRSGYSHMQVVVFYMGWNLLIVLPVVCWMNRTSAARMSPGIGSAIAVYALAVVVWWSGKRCCLARNRHAAA
jgi:UDP-N-acetylmuramyl pentapeptide phosphotransferase/UDP-N-acetylglucosamine-1-phosphate transferase